MRKKALVTGATGYIGSKVCERLLSDNWEVGAVVRSASMALKPLADERVVAIEYDGITQSLVKGIGEFAPDIVFHLASLFLSDHDVSQVSDLINSNILFSAQLIEACAQCGVLNFINTGTSWQHYKHQGYDPVCLYAATKQAFEDIAKYYVDAHGIKFVTLKLFDTYGPKDPRKKLINIILKSAYSDQFLDISPGEQEIDLVHVDDVVSAYLIAADRMFSCAAVVCESYKVASGRIVKVKDLIPIIEEQFGAKIRVNIGGRTYRKREVMKVWRGGEILPGWEPTISLEDGLKDIVRRERTQYV